jgi:hypothetical protein
MASEFRGSSRPGTGRIIAVAAITVAMLFSAFAGLSQLTSAASTDPSGSGGSLGSANAITPSTCTQSAPSLGLASTFAALSATTLTNTGSSSLTGDIGVGPGSAVVGFPPGTYTGQEDLADSAAEVDVTNAYNAVAADVNCPTSVAGNIGGETLTPGLYKSTSTLAISSGDLTLTGDGVFIFQIASGLTTTSGRTVILSGGAEAGDIFWDVGSSATLGTTSVMQGTILAYASITMATGAHLNGRALARTGDVTLSDTTIVVPGSPFGGGSGTSGGATPFWFWGVVGVVGVGAAAAVVLAYRGRVPHHG